MNAKDFFSSIRDADRQCITLLDAIEQLKAMQNRTTAALQDVPIHGHGGINRSLEDTVGRLVDLQRSVQTAVDDVAEKKAKAFDIIGKIKNEKQRRVLIDRYITAKTFEQISVDMGYSYFGVCKLHGQALKSADFVMEFLENSEC